jgi:hypothetical protein
VPTSTIVSTAFLTHGRLAAKNLQLDDLPLVVTPHPLNDLTPADVRELARCAYPIIIRQLTGQGALEKHTLVDYVHPAARNRAPRDAGQAPEAA